MRDPAASPDRSAAAAAARLLPLLALLASCGCAQPRVVPRDTPDPAPAAGAPGGFSAAVERHLAAVAEVLVLRDAPGREAALPEPLPLLPRGEAWHANRSFASGFFIDADGHALATAHTVVGASEVWIQTAQGRRLRARVLGIDARHDVALLKADARGLPAVPLEPAVQVRPGQWVFAIGAPFGLRRSVTAGIVSAWPRYLHGSGTAFIQTDTALNPGSSGGPVFDAAGRLVGMGTMVLSDSGVYAGVSLVLPAADVARIAARLRGGRPDAETALGLRLQPLEDGLQQAFGVGPPGGALLTAVPPGSQAARAGLRAGDVLLGLRGERLGYQDLQAALAAAPPGSTLLLQVWRAGAAFEVPLDEQAEEAGTTPGDAGGGAGAEERLGLQLLEWAPARGARPVLQVDDATGSALLAGVEEGDRIAAVNGTPVATLADFDAALDRLAAHPVVALLVRDGVASYVPVWRRVPAAAGTAGLAARRGGAQQRGEGGR